MKHWINVFNTTKYAPSSPLSAEAHATEGQARREVVEYFDGDGTPGRFYAYTIIVEDGNATMANWEEWAIKAVFEDRQHRRDQDAHVRSFSDPS